MNPLLNKYEELLGHNIIHQLYQISKPIKGIKIVHINSTKQGGGVAEILTKMVPLTNALGIQTHWEVIQGNSDFFTCTKLFHNGLQGRTGSFPSESQLREFEKKNQQNAVELAPILHEADVVIIHDPQPLALITHFPERKGKWIWRCHIDVSQPNRMIWKYLKGFIQHYDASIFSLADFAQPLTHPMFLIPPSIDPFSEKNIDLPKEEIEKIYPRFNIDPARPMILQVSRFDRFKDPLGVIQAYRLAKKFKKDLQLVLAGGGAPDDPEGELILEEVRKSARGDPDIHVLFLPSDSNLTINALQRAADIVIQKSIKEGFGLTVTEALWKGKPVIGGNTGGIRLQVIPSETGYLVNTPEGAALSIRYLLQNRSKIQELGEKGRNFVKENFLITRHLREYLTLILTLFHSKCNRTDLDRLGES